MKQNQLDQCVIGAGVIGRVKDRISRLEEAQRLEEQGVGSVQSLVAAIKDGIKYVKDDWGKPNQATQLNQKLQDKLKELEI